MNPDVQLGSQNPTRCGLLTSFNCLKSVDLALADVPCAGFFLPRRCSGLLYFYYRNSVIKMLLNVLTTGSREAKSELDTLTKIKSASGYANGFRQFTGVPASTQYDQDIINRLCM